MKIISAYTTGSHKSYIKLRTYLSLCIEGVSVDSEYFVNDKETREWLFNKYNFDTFPAFILIDENREVLIRAENNFSGMEKLAKASLKKLRL